MRKFLSIIIAAQLAIGIAPALAQTAKPGGQAQWDKTVEAAKKEGNVVVSIPASAELRKLTEEAFKKRFGIDVELVTARGSAIIRRIADESKAGVRHFDIHIGGSNSVVSGLLEEGVLEPLEPWLILPEVKDPK
ncbi:hypothetical protein EPO44_14750, partial [bacterium]